MKKIRNLKDLAEHTGASHPTKESIAHRLYKDTSCGIGFSCNATSVTVSGYCEGTDASCESRTLQFPFTGKEFDAEVEAADQDGNALWNQTHGCDDCGLDGAVNPDCKSCGGDGIVI